MSFIYGCKKGCGWESMPKFSSDCLPTPPQVAQLGEEAFLQGIGWKEGRSLPQGQVASREING